MPTMRLISGHHVRSKRKPVHKNHQNPGLSAHLLPYVVPTIECFPVGQTLAVQMRNLENVKTTMEVWEKPLPHGRLKSLKQESRTSKFLRLIK